MSRACRDVGLAQSGAHPYTVSRPLRAILTRLPAPEDDYGDAALRSINPARIAPRFSEMHVQEFNGWILEKLGNRLLHSISFDDVSPDQHIFRIEGSDR
jgi:hypothetical protein